MESRKSAKVQPKRKSKRSQLGSKRSIVAARPDAKPFPQRVFLYLQLEEIVNMPVVSYPLELHLHHEKNTLQKMCDHYTQETIIYENEFKMDRPAFAMGIMQDNLEDMNTFSDNPLVVTLYQRIPRHRKDELITVSTVRGEASAWFFRSDKKPVDAAGGDASVVNDTVDTEAEGEAEGEVEEEDDEGEYVEESLEFVSRGHCDLLQLFQRKRFIHNVQIMLYPEYSKNLQTETTQKITTTSNWHMYSILPILKHIHFSNVVFITLESVYNAPEELHSRAADLGMSISLRSLRVEDEEPVEVLPVCDFFSFNSQIISDQTTVIVWETIKRDLLKKQEPGVASVQMETSLRVPIHRILERLLKTQGVDFQLEKINPFVDSALVSNSMHRYVITGEMQDILEAAVVNNDYEVLLQLYDTDPSKVLYEGVINLSIFGYPDVNACRFASVLNSAERRSTRKTFRMTNVDAPSLPMFAIMKLCFFQTLSTRNASLDTYNESKLKAGQLCRCFTIDPLVETNSRDVLKELYRRFDELIKDVISYIIKNDLTNVDERRNYFCCTLGNLSNLLINICGNDFNVRMPTKTNIEFREMLTHMHKDLMERIVRILNDCGWEALGNCVINKDRDLQRMRRLLDEHRNLCMVGDCVLAKQLFAELKSACTCKMMFNFYVFLNSVQTLNFKHAEAYLLNQMEYNWDGEYFVNLLKLYIDYQIEIKSELDQEREMEEMPPDMEMELEAETEAAELKKPRQAYSNMMANLCAFATANNLDCEGWILLHCYYKEKNYLPGMEYTRWRYENLYDVPSRSMPLTPRPLYETFMPLKFDLTDKSVHVIKFYEVFKKFANLGAYAFAETVYSQIAAEFPPIETYLVTTTLKMLQGQIDELFQVRQLPTDSSERGLMMKYYQAHINGNVEYSRQRYLNAIEFFKELLTIDKEDTSTLAMFYLSYLRLARLSFECEDFELALQAYELCVPTAKTDKNFMANYGMGLTLYYLNRLEEAIVYLARSTEVDIYIPDSWGFLATINLRLGRNKTALNCWKVAKMYPEITMCKRVYTELDKIKYSDVNLLVEDDNQPT
ncbi:hypothetical protein AWZ03_006593 [Drosophila navojoa]|uniref:Uncharacterized protein n=1 Tax=Drosophila navojoa TaxID=7232 RepID=A0A484BFE8_DRONA|nr:uncharacterized protein LOC115562588 [Drosophila navojoa]TDG47012.1 hypothetical protein AWZ03_006593 [Drosophila navojoa]